MAKKYTTTIQMPDTIDSWTRRIHINQRGGKVTMVYRWKSRKDGTNHTQRMTLEDREVAHLIVALSRAAHAATQGDEPRVKAFMDTFMGLQAERFETE